MRCEQSPGTPNESSAVGLSVGDDGNVHTLYPSEQILYRFNPRACTP